MKFVSRNSNLMVVLKPGLPGSHLTGQAPVTGVYVKFQNGVVDVKEESIVEMMKKHPGFNIDYIAVEDGVKEEDPYAYYRSETEPVHTTTEIKYGHAEKSVSSPKKNKMPIELENLIKSEASKLASAMVKEMLPNLIREAIESIPSKNEKETGTNVKIDSTEAKNRKAKKDEAESPTD